MARTLSAQSWIFSFRHSMSDAAAKREFSWRPQLTSRSNHLQSFSLAYRASSSTALPCWRYRQKCSHQARVWSWLSFTACQKSWPPRSNNPQDQCQVLFTIAAQWTLVDPRLWEFRWTIWTYWANSAHYRCAFVCSFLHSQPAFLAPWFFQLTNLSPIWVRSLLQYKFAIPLTCSFSRA